MRLSRLHANLWGARLLLAAYMLCFSAFAFAQVPASFASANALYKANQFAEAGVVYEKLLTEGYKDAVVYYNLGNCYYKQNQLGKAIVNYERAKRLNPEDEDINHNLKLANAHLADKVQPVPTLGIVRGWNNFTASHSSGGWGWYAIGTIWLAFIAFALYLFTDLKKIMAGLGATLLFSSIVFVLLALGQYNRENNSGEAVLTVASTYVKSAPDDNGTNVFMLHEGIKFRLLDNVSSWYKVRLADGKVGWVERTHFEKI